MYILKRLDGKVLYYLLEKRQYTIGRKGTDILIENDKSISRNHAIFTISDSGDLYLKDLNSSYNTYYNTKQLKPDEITKVENNSVIKFGALDSVFNIEKLNIITSTSLLGNTEKTNLKNLLVHLNGRIDNNWTKECTHLTTDQISVTLKVLNALIDGKPIVTSKFWDKFLANVKSNLPLPDTKDFQPPRVEALLNKKSINFNAKRHDLFKNKTFIFTNKTEKEQMEQVIQKVGGKCVLWENGSSPNFDDNNELLLIQETDESTQLIQENPKFGKRSIPMQEIAMAILLGSCEKDCNPQFIRKNAVFGRNTQLQVTDNTPLVMETQSQESLQPVPVKQELIIPETLESEINTPISKIVVTKSNTNINKPNTLTNVFKRPNVGVSAENPYKKIKLESPKNESLNVSKQSSTNSTFSARSSTDKGISKRNPFATNQLKVETDQENDAEEIRAKRPRLNVFNQQRDFTNRSVDEIDGSQILPKEKLNKSDELNPLMSKIEIVESTRRDGNEITASRIHSRLLITNIDSLSTCNTTGSLNNTTLRNVKRFQKQFFKKTARAVFV